MEVTGKKNETPDNEHCEPCEQEQKTKIADGFCQQCEEYMCQTCFEHHLKGKACRDHTLVGKDQAPLSVNKGRQTRKCEKHASETVKFYCKQHNLTGCGDCMLLEHRQCTLDYIQDIADKYPKSQEYTQFKAKIDNAYMKVKNCLSKITENKTAVANTQKKVIEQIKQFRKEIDSLLDEAQRSLEARVKEYESEDINQVSKHEQEVMELNTQLLEVKGTLDHECGFDLFMMTVKYASIPDKVEEKLTYSDQKINVEDFYFVAGAELKKCVQCAGSLGVVQRETALVKKSDVELVGKAIRHGIKVGDRVRRGKDWKWGDQDSHGTGIVTGKDPSFNGWFRVCWNNGTEQSYRMGGEGCYDLEILY